MAYFVSPKSLLCFAVLTANNTVDLLRAVWPFDSMFVDFGSLSFVRSITL